MIHLPDDAELSRFEQCVPFVLLDGAWSWSRGPVLLQVCGESSRIAASPARGTRPSPKTDIIQVRWKGLQRGLGKLAVDGDWRIVGALSEARARGSTGTLV